VVVLEEGRMDGWWKDGSKKAKERREEERKEGWMYRLIEW
jgi:hypothetical protein